MRIDVHCHVAQRFRPFAPRDRFSFEPVEGYAPGDAYLSPRLTGGLLFPLLMWWLGLPRNVSDREFDATLERFFLNEVLGAEQIDRVVVLAMDQYHSADGTPVGPRRRGPDTGTDLYVSNTYARELWRRYPQRILFGASIHPYRRFKAMTALDMLDEAAAAGAVLVKWLPLAQNIDARDQRTINFLRRAAKLNMPMLIHYGGEAILANHHGKLADPAPLLQTLRELREQQAMPTVIVAHMASPGPLESSRSFDVFTQALLGEFADAPLYADISALAMPHRAKWLKRIARRPELHGKLVYGSDFPLPPLPVAFRWTLGRYYYAEVKTAKHWLDRDVLLKCRLGIGAELLERGSVLLKNRIALAHALINPLVKCASSTNEKNTPV